MSFVCSPENVTVLLLACVELTSSTGVVEFPSAGVAVELVELSILQCCYSPGSGSEVKFQLRPGGHSRWHRSDQ